MIWVNISDIIIVPDPLVGNRKVAERLIKSGFASSEVINYRILSGTAVSDLKTAIEEKVFYD